MFLQGVLAQRLVRKVCQDCKEGTDAPAELVKDFKQVLGSLVDHYLNSSVPKEGDDKLIVDDLKSIKADKITIYKGKGCEKCSNTGYIGRIGIFEVLEVTNNVAHLTLDNSPASKIEEVAIEEGMLTLLQDGYLRVLEGVTTLEEVMRVAK